MLERDIVLRVQDLSVSFKGNTVFNAVCKLSFDIRAGETLAIVGESGSGKSLTALSLVGLLPPAAQVTGTIILNGGQGDILINNIKKDEEWQGIRGREMGIIFQEPMSSLNPLMKIGRQLEEAIAGSKHLPATELHKTALSWLQKVQLPNPDTMFDRYPHQLSGGQKQRVMIAMAMSKNPALLIADEPTTALDVTVQQEIVKLMQVLQEEYHTAMIFITHDLALAATIANHVLVMYKGEEVEYGTVARVFNTPSHPYTRALIACNPSGKNKNERLPVVADFLRDEVALPVTFSRGVYNELIGSNANSPVLTVNDLTIRFSEKKSFFEKKPLYFNAVDGVSFSLKRGVVTGLVGESGCGKSTLSRALMGLVPITRGNIFFNGMDMAGASHTGWHTLRRKIQMIFQDPYSSLNPRMTIGAILREPLSVHKVVANNAIEQEVLRLLDMVQLPASAMDKYPHQFSGGQRQRVGIARALALRPELIICDEIVSALDVSIQAQILNLLKDIQYEFQLSYLFISHNLSVVEYMSDDILIMRLGKIVEYGNAADVLKNPVQEYTQKLIKASL